MILDPVATFFIYIGVIGLVFTVAAALADWLGRDLPDPMDGDDA